MKTRVLKIVLVAFLSIMFISSLAVSGDKEKGKKETQGQVGSR